MAENPLLVAEGLRRVVGERTLFEGLSFQLKRGEALALQAPSGTGKTALLRLLAWLDPLQGGSVTFDGRSPTEWGVPQYRRRVTYVSQSPPRLAGTPRVSWDFLANTREGSARAPTPLESLLPELGLDLSTLDQRWSSVSAGEAQRLCLALALALGPEVLLLDEPTASLDEDSTALVEATLQGRCALWVTHDRAQAERVAPRVLSLDELQDTAGGRP